MRYILKNSFKGAIALLVLACCQLAYTLCFEDTSMGGWLPFLLLGFGPALGYAVAKLEALPEPVELAEEESIDYDHS